MSRLHVLAAKPRTALGALFTVLLATGAVVGSGADFTASAANPANTFSTGTLSMVNSKSGAAVLTAAGLKPGNSATGDVDIENTGSLSGAFTLARGAITNSDSSNPLTAKLNVTIDDCGAYAGATAPTCGDGDDVTKYTGSITEMGTTGHEVSSLGSFAGGDKHRYRFTVVLDASAGNAYQGDNGSVVFDWTAS